MSRVKAKDLLHMDAMCSKCKDWLEVYDDPKRGGVTVSCDCDYGLLRYTSFTNVDIWEDYR